MTPFARNRANQRAGVVREPAPLPRAASMAQLRADAERWRLVAERQTKAVEDLRAELAKRDKLVNALREQIVNMSGEKSPSVRTVGVDPSAKPRPRKG